MQRGFTLRAYLAASHLLGPIAGPLLHRRLQRGKEHATRWVEKTGLDLVPRPDGQLVWLHAVGLGEILSLRGLIAAMAKLRPDLSFLITSTTKSSADVIVRQMPPCTIHQFLPIDAPIFRRRFLDHFRPNLCVWAEQDLWPGLVSDLSARGIPQCIIAARMNKASFNKHWKAAALYRDLYSAMSFITAQDEMTAHYIAQLGANAQVTGSLKPAAPILACNDTELSNLRNAIGHRLVWAVAPAHPADVAIAMKAHNAIRKTKPDALLIIAPRFLDTLPDGAWPRRSLVQKPTEANPIWLFDTFGELGLVYRLSRAALIGGTFSDIEGHNPWEAAALHTAIIHGPRTANFAADYAQLAAAQASFQVQSADDVAKAVLDLSQARKIENAAICIKDAAKRIDMIAQRVIALVDR